MLMNLEPQQREDICEALADVTHAISNPLSIISGNAQLLRVLAESEGLSDDFVQPIEDIEEASTRVASLMTQLNQLKDRLHPEASS